MSETLLDEFEDLGFRRGDGGVDLELVGPEEGLEVDDIEEGGAVGLGEGEVEEEHGLEEVIEWDP